MIKFRRRRNKHNNRKVEFDGYTFDSVAECARYKVLKLREKAGEIFELNVHPKYILQEKFRSKTYKYPSSDPEKDIAIRAITHIPDFEYYDYDLKQIVVEDVKGYQTDSHSIKMKLFIKRYPDIRYILYDAKKV